MAASFLMKDHSVVLCPAQHIQSQQTHTQNIRYENLRSQGQELLQVMKSHHLVGVISTDEPIEITSLQVYI